MVVFHRYDNIWTQQQSICKVELATKYKTYIIAIIAAVIIDAFSIILTHYAISGLGRVELLAALVVLLHHPVGLLFIPLPAVVVGRVGLLGAIIHPARIALVVVEALGHGLGRLPPLPQLTAVVSKGLVVNVAVGVAGKILDGELREGVVRHFPGGGRRGGDESESCDDDLHCFFLVCKKVIAFSTGFQ